jgi:type II secretory pathway pseudopilin PulG
MSRNRSGFSLVELLVVIGFIAILISLLMPAIQRARQQTNTLRCMANLRTLGEALTRYTIQTGYYPGGFVDWRYVMWPTRLRQFMGGNQDAFYCPSRGPEYEWTPMIVSTGAARTSCSATGTCSGSRPTT